MPVKNRILFIFSLYRFLEDFMQWMGISLWGITLRPICGVRVADAGPARRSLAKVAGHAETYASQDRRRVGCLASRHFGQSLHPPSCDFGATSRRIVSHNLSRFHHLAVVRRRFGSVLIWRQTTIREANVSCWATNSWRAWEAHFARTRQLTFSPCFSQARMEEKSREFARRETRFTRIDANALLVAPKETEAEAERRPATYHSSPNI